MTEQEERQFSRLEFNTKQTTQRCRHLFNGMVTQILPLGNKNRSDKRNETRRDRERDNMRSRVSIYKRTTKIKNVEDVFLRVCVVTSAQRE